MRPYQLLVVVLLMTAGALAWQFRARLRRGAKLRELGAKTKMHFSQGDRFALGARVAKIFPVAGVADVRVSDLLYRSDEAVHYYIFRIDYTRGVLQAKHRRRAVAMLTEPRQVLAGPPPEMVFDLAPEGKDEIVQYEILLNLLNAA